MNIRRVFLLTGVGIMILGIGFLFAFHFAVNSNEPAGGEVGVVQDKVVSGEPSNDSKTSEEEVVPQVFNEYVLERYISDRNAEIKTIYEYHGAPGTQYNDFRLAYYGLDGSRSIVAEKILEKTVDIDDSGVDKKYLEEVQLYLHRDGKYARGGDAVYLASRQSGGTDAGYPTSIYRFDTRTTTFTQVDLKGAIPSWKYHIVSPDYKRVVIVVTKEKLLDRFLVLNLDTGNIEADIVAENKIGEPTHDTFAESSGELSYYLGIKWVDEKTIEYKTFSLYGNGAWWQLVPWDPEKAYLASTNILRLE